MRKIITEFIYPPIPIRNHDWVAYYEDYEQYHSYGETEQEAIAHLKEDWPEEDL